MAKLLDRPAPRSPLAAMFDPEVTARATSVVHALPPATLPRPRAARPCGIKRECVLSARTDETLARLTESIRRTTGARISVSQTVRALLLLVEPAWPRIEQELRALGPLQQPSNAPGNESAREALERTLAGAIVRAVRCSDGVP